jgi:hypothetical protein
MQLILKETYIQKFLVHLYSHIENDFDELHLNGSDLNVSEYFEIYFKINKIIQPVLCNYADYSIVYRNCVSTPLSMYIRTRIKK